VEDLYSAIGVSKTASAEEIKKAYREAAFKYHPDRNPGDKSAEEKFKTINAAYTILGDETKRREYDRWGSTDSYTAYTNASRGNTASPDEQSDDPFRDWFENMQRQNGTEQRKYTQYGPFGWSTDRPDEERKPAKEETLASLVKSILALCAGIFFFRFSWFILPIGPIISIGAMINGLNGIIRSIKRLFSTKS
jgi:molecular chaperone DnaJ